ncbi:hypothetical protein SAMN04489719_1819 [Agrococcus carbonis]|uniref:DUF4232 domain-containing protein n=2 Tax=Agrococcus carbonis TaxID=684552 RepID=A0A1H1QF15_9MICO|nr:hypothetical protein SAMN04489719_1819 [Agrococcus carbonis]
MLGLGVLVLIAALVALLVWRPWEGADAPQSPAASETPDAASEAPQPSETPEPTQSQPFTPIGGDPSAAASAPCEPEQIRLTPQTDRSIYSGDDPVRLSFTIENTGEAACALNAGTSVQEYEIRTGDEVVYRWTDCATDVSDNVVALQPGAPQSTVPIEWDRTRSSSDACSGEGQPVTAGGAAYWLSVSVGEYTSQDERQFILE